MRVAITGLRGFPNVAGGVETHCEMLLPRVQQRLNEATLTILARAPYVAADLREHAGIRIIPIWTIRQKHLEALAHTFASIIYARARLKPHIVHIHAIGPALAAPLARALGLKVIVTHHGADYRRQKWGMAARAALRLGERLAVGAAHAIIAVSPSIAEELKARFPTSAARIRIVPNGAPKGEAPARGVLERLGLSPGFLLSVGRLVPEKGFEDLIHAHAARGDPRTLVIVGEADHKDGYARDLRKAAAPNVRFTGRLTRPELAALYRACGLFVLASHHEGLPIAALEAMEARAPILLSDIRANRDLGLGADNYFPAGHVPALARGLGRDPRRLRPDPALLAMFDWDSAADKTAAIYREVAAQAL